MKRDNKNIAIIILAWLYVPRNYDVWDKDLRGFPSNPIELAYFYPCYWDE